MRILTLVVLAALSLPALPATAQNLRGFDVRPSSSEPELSGIRRALIVGIDDYQDERIPRLEYAASDAMAFAGWLNSAAAGIPVDSAVVLLNSDADYDAVLGAYRELVALSEPGDELIVYFSGHGGVRQVHSSSEGYLFPHDADAEDVAKRGISLNDINKEVAYLEGRNPVLLILDACRSGNLFNANLLSVALESLGGNVRRLVSSEGGQDSMEGPQWEPGHGAFTYFLLSGLYGMADVNGNGDGEVTLAELGLWVVDNVEAETNFAQSPQVQPFDHKWVITRVVPQFQDSVRTVLASRSDSYERAPVRVATRGAPAPAAEAPASSPESGAPGAAELRLGQTVTGRLDTADSTMPDGTHYDIWTYDGQAGERISVTMRSSQFDPYLILAMERGGELTALHQNDDGGGGTDARLTFELPETATYLIYANAISSTDLGDYMLALEVGTAVETPLPDALREAASYPSIALGGEAAGTLGDESPLLPDQTPYEAWSFTAQAGDLIEIEMRSEDFDAYLVIGAESGTELLTRDDDSGGGLDALAVFEAPASGRYVVLANAVQQSARGAFTLRMDRARPVSTVAQVLTAEVAGARRIAAGQSVSGELDRTSPLLEDRSAYHLFAYDAREGERITVTLRSDDFDAYLGIGRGDPAEGGLWVKDDDSGGGTDSRIAIEFPAAGRYAIVANTLSPGSTGRYTLAVEEGAAGGVVSTIETVFGARMAAEARPVTLRQTAYGRLDDSSPRLDGGSAFELWRYSGTPGEQVSVTMTSEDVDAYLVVGHMADAGGAISNDDSAPGNTDASLTTIVPAGGELLIVARTYGSGGRGGYALDVRPGTGPVTMTLASLLASDEAASARVLEADQPVAGMLDESDRVLAPDGAYADIWRFRGAAGDRVTVTMESGDVDAFLYVGRIGGQEIGSDDDGYRAGDTDAQVVVRLPEDGEYLVVAKSFGAGATGAYLLRRTLTSAAEVESEGPQPIRTGTVSTDDLIRIALAEDAPELRSGAAVSGVLSSMLRLQEDGSPALPFVVRGTAGQTVVVTLQSADFDTYLIAGDLLAGEPRVLAQDDDGAGGTDSRLELRIPASGELVVLVNSFDDSGGAFTLRVDPAGAGASGDIAAD